MNKDLMMKQILYIFSHDLGFLWWFLLVIFLLTLLSIIVPGANNPISIFYNGMSNIISGMKSHYNNLFPIPEEREKESIEIDDDNSPFRGE